MKKIVGLFLMFVFLIVQRHVILAAQNPPRETAPASRMEGFTIKTAATLRKACQEAMAEYGNEPEKLGNTACGSYIQGYLMGFNAGVLEAVPKDGTDLPLKVLKKIGERELCHERHNLGNFIEDYLMNIKRNPIYKGSAQEDLLWSMAGSCKTVKEDR